MKELIIKELHVGWHQAKKSDKQVLAYTKIGSEQINARIVLQSFIGTKKNLFKNIEKKKQEYDPVNSIQESFTMKNVKWYADYFISNSEPEKYRAFFYALLDLNYVLIEFAGNSMISNMHFLAESRRLIGCIDLSAVREDSLLVIGESEIEVKTPEGFRLNKNSTESSLVYTKNGAYLVIGNLLGENSLTEWLNEALRRNEYGLLDSKAISGNKGITEDNKIIWASYKVVSQERVTATGTYFGTIFRGIKVFGFLFESGEANIDISSLLEFGR